MRVLFYDTADKLALGNAAALRHASRSCSSAADVGHAARRRPRRQRGHVRRRAVRRGCGRGSLFLNLSRGFVVDHAALRDAHPEPATSPAPPSTSSPSEPKAQGDEFVSELRGLPNVILTPHIGGSTEEAQQDIGRFVAGKLRDYVADGTTTLSVNLPTVALHGALGRARSRCTPPQRARRAGHGQRACSPSTASTSRGSCWPPAASSATSSPTSTPSCTEDLLTALRGLPETVRLTTYTPPSA